MRSRTLVITSLVLVAGLGGAYGSYLYSKLEDDLRWVPRVTGGNRARAPMLMIANGCAGCHAVPGIPGARGTVGPPLANYAYRGFIGGSLPNTADNLVSWIRHSRDIDPHTAMPNTHVSEQDARDMAAFLYDPCIGAEIWSGACFDRDRK